MDIFIIVLKIFGVTSVLGLLAALAALYAFPPNIALESVRDKGRTNFESRLVFKNIGKIPAFNVIGDVTNLNLRLAGLQLTNATFTNCGFPTERLSGGETMEFPACPHASVPAGSTLHSCEYDLCMKYEMRIPFIKRLLAKRWHVELRNARGEFTWQTSLR
jgi:hypothetical protein